MRPLTTLIVLAALVAALLSASTATADVVILDVYCVNANPCLAGGKAEPTIQNALDDAASDPGPATVIVGKPFGGVPYVGPFTYDDHGIAGNDVTLQGQGRPTLLTTTDHTAAVTIHGKGSEIGGFHVIVPGTPSTDGVALDGAHAFSLIVEGIGSKGINRGVVMSNDASLFTSTITMATGFGVELTGGPSKLSQTTINAPFGLIGGASDLLLDRTRIRGEHLAVQLVGSGGGNGGDVPDGLLSLRSVLTTSANDGRAAFVMDAPATFVRTTLASVAPDPDPDRAGIRFEARSRSGFLTVSRTVIGGGYRQSIVRDASAGRLADLTAVDSEWAVAREAKVGAGTFTETRSNIADGQPRFVDKAGDDFRLRGNDPGIDRNQQANPDTFNETDFISHGPVDGNGDGKAATDAGAFEYQRHAPGLLDVQVPQSGTAGSALAFAAKTIDGDGDHVALKWAFGDGSSASGLAVGHTYAAAGTYDVTLTAKDDAGLTTKVTRQVAIAPGPVKPSSGSTVEDVPPAPTGSDDTSSPTPPPPPPGDDAGAPPPPPPLPPGGDDAADRTAPRILSARLRARRSAVRRGLRARLTLRLDEAATVQIAIVRKRGGRRIGRRLTLSLAAGASAKRVAIGHRRLRALARRRAVLSIVAIDAAGNRSAPMRVRLKVRR
jgi:PKD domain-containing protein